MAKRRTGVNRREFLKHSAVAAGAITVGSMSGCASSGFGGGQRSVKGVSIVSNNAIAAEAPSKWAIDRLKNALERRSIPARTCNQIAEADPADLCITFEDVIWLPGPPSWLEPLIDKNELIQFSPTEQNGRRVLKIGSGGARGVVYGLSELSDRVELESDPLSSLQRIEKSTELPHNQVRSVMRMFCSDIEDKGWYNDREFWREYLTMLVTHRYNRFNLSLGLGYDFARDMLDTYFYFAYPFLVKVPGYDVRATNLPDAERDRNLEMLRFISDEATLRGLHFQLGLWTHAYQWTNSPRVNHNIEGLPADQHAAYCRDALTLVLKECPNIAGVTFRIHGESGVNEGSYDFWKTVFTGVVNSGRRMPIDMHAKGMDQGMIDTALSTGLPITISPKYWAEHMGLPYHQAAIRPTELPTRARGNALMALSTGERSFTRYGYGDLLPEDRKYGIIHRMWPGTQRLLLWGDPVFAASYGRASSFCGSLGCEIMEPLSFKGRKGSGIAEGGRTAYKDASLRPKYDFEKYTYTYRLWGRLMYNPDAKPETWQRELKKDYGPAAVHVEPALASASRILPLFTTAHTPSAANNNYWPEMYVNMSIINPGPNSEPYGDTPTPRRFGTVSPLDPQMFSRIEDHVDELIKGELSGKYSPADVAKWLEQMANRATDELDRAGRLAGNRQSAEYRRMEIDVAVQAQLGLFFANKLRAGLCFALAEKTGDSEARIQAFKLYRAARDHWARIIDLTKDVYVADVTVGIGYFQRGHWVDRLERIDADIAAMEQVQNGNQKETGLVSAILSPPARAMVVAPHKPVETFRRGQAIPIRVDPGTSVMPHPQSVTLYYRHTHQAEAWQTAEMKYQLGPFIGMIPAEYTDTPHPIIYYLELRDTSGRTRLSPGFNETLSNQPYFLIRQATA